MDEIILKIYDDDFKQIQRVVKAEMPVVPFGTIRKLMKLFNVENMTDTSQIMTIAISSWDSLIKILDTVFPGVEEDDWDRVDTKELIGAVWMLIRFAAGELMKVPADPKN